MNNITVGFIGLGKLGLECAEVFAQHYITYGYDIEPRKSDSVNVVDSMEELVEKSDWIFIAVQTPHEEDYCGARPAMHLDPKDFNYNTVKIVLEDINKYATAEKNIVLISTVLPGTTRREFDPLLDNHTLIYNPYLIAMGTTKWDMVNPEMLIVGSKDGNDPRVEELLQIYSPMMDQEETRAECGTWEEAESIKIFYNTFISAKIGLVNMIQDFAMKIGNINSDVVAGALARSTKRITGPQYMVPGMGDAGACHPRDNIALRWLAEEHQLGYDLFEAIMRAREVQAENLAKFIFNKSQEYDLPIVIHGKAYKPDVPYEIGSYSVLVGFYIERLIARTEDCNTRMFYADPLTGDNIDVPMKAVVLWAHNKAVTYGYTGHVTEDAAYFEILKGSVIIDPWRRINRDNDMYEVVWYGDTRE